MSRRIRFMLSLTIRRRRRHWECWGWWHNVRTVCVSLIVHVVGFVEVSVLWKRKI